MITNTKSKAYWEKEFSSWTMVLKDILKDPYMDKLMTFLSLQYSTQTLIPPRTDLFRYFRICNWQDIKIVILTPSYATLTNMGKVSYNKHIYDHAQGPISKVAQEIERVCYNGLNIEFDYNLEHWGRQGILVLPLSLTYNKDIGECHKKQWNKFIQFVIQQLNDYRQGTIFLEWGTDLRLYKHWEFKAENPELAFQQEYDWKFDFTKVNKKIKELNNIEIKW